MGDNYTCMKWTNLTFEPSQMILRIKLVAHNSLEAHITACSFCIFRLRMQLLGVWTLNVKRIGKTLICFMLITVKNFDDKEVGTCIYSIRFKKISGSIEV